MFCLFYMNLQHINIMQKMSSFWNYAYYLVMTQGDHYFPYINTCTDLKNIYFYYAQLYANLHKLLFYLLILLVRLINHIVKLRLLLINIT